MSRTWPVYCENAELAIELGALAEGMRLPVAPEVRVAALDAAVRRADAGADELVGCLLASAPAGSELVRVLADLAHPERLVIGFCGAPQPLLLGLCRDLGTLGVHEVSAALAALAIRSTLKEGLPRASARKLTAIDRARLGATTSEKGGARLISLPPLHVGLETGGTDAPLCLGPAHAVRVALDAVRASERLADPPPEVKVDAAAAREVLFGPARVLSDPASKAALAPYGLPLPQEELCSSPSRAASEAARIGFPVRISLASPDLRVWDHPDLAVDGVDNAARVRDVYRQLSTLALERSPSARVLGVTVAATTLARALLRFEAQPVERGRALLRVGFADPHGAAARDVTWTALPLGPRAMERVFARLCASSLVLGGSPREREASLAALATLLAQVGAFLHDFARQVERVDLHPVALLVGGGAEVREIAITVTDAFSRDLA